jgi:long-chain acyl-CoA synthetase
MSAEETEFIFSDSKASAFITSKEFEEKIRIAGQVPEIRHIIVMGENTAGDYISYEDLINCHSEKIDIEEMDEDDTALLIYTAGTTGRPKGVMLSHGNLFHHVTATYKLWDRTRPRRTISCLPLAHMFGVTAMLVDQLNEVPGSVLVLMEWFDPEEMFRLIEKYKIGGMGGVPTMYWILLNHPSLGKYDLISWHRCAVGASPVPEELQKRYKNELNIDMIEAYGLSESCSAVACTRPEQVRKQGSAGTAIGKAVIKIFDEEDNELPPGKPGEIAVRGPIVMKGYHNRPEETAKALRGGWLHTGDIGYLDEDGYLFITDRKKDMIIKGGENIFPSEIENVLLKHPDIVEAAVIGIPDKIYGEEVVAFVVKKQEAEINENEIISHCIKNYTKFKCPGKVRFIENLPKSPVGKILKKDLRKMW